MIFTEEVEKLDTYRDKIIDSATDLMDFIRSDKFLQNQLEFERLVGAFQVNLVILVDITENPLPPIPAEIPPTMLPAPQQSTPEKTESRGLGIGKIILSVATIIICYAAVHQGYVPGEILTWVIGATVGLMFLPSIIGASQKAISRLRHGSTDVERSPAGLRLKQIHDDLTRMRERYVSAYLLAKFQKQGVVPDYKVLGIDEELYIRSKQLAVTLAPEFNSLIGRIVNDCEESIWRRKALLGSFIAQYNQAAVVASRGRRVV